MLYSCGHEVYTTLRTREQYLQKKNSPGLCPDCKKRDLATKPRKSELTLPELTGSPKQVAWAEQIRAKVIEHKEELLNFMKQVAKENEEHLPAYLMHVLDNFIETETSARNWIDAFKPITSQFSKRPPRIHIMGAMAQLPDLFVIDTSDVLFLYNVGKIAQ